MQVQESFRPVTDLANLDRTPCVQGEPSIKNIHTSTHLLVLNNTLIFLAIDQCLHIYSLPKIAQNKAPLLNIIPLAAIFKDFRRQHFQDLISSIFSNAQKEDFSQQIFQGEENSNNVLLNVEHYANRLKYLNNSIIKVKHMEFNAKGDLAVLLVDGRAAVISYFSESRGASWWAGNKYSSVSINELTKEKIDLVCFLDQDTICVLSNGRISAFQIISGQKTKVFSHRLGLPHANQLHGRKIQKQRYRLHIVCSTTIHIIEPTRKKIALHQTVSFETYISQCFFHRSHIFAVTVDAITRLSTSSAYPQKQILCQLSEPCQVLHLDPFGNFTKRSPTSNRQSLWLVDCTTNGVYAGVTIRRGGNYKEGRLVVFEPTQHYYLLRLITNVRELIGDHSQEYVQTSDAVFVPRNKQNKQILQNFTNLHKQGQLIYDHMTLTEQQYFTVSINIGHAFYGKQLAKTKIIDKMLNTRLMKILSLKKKLDYTSMVERCCFSGVPIYEQEVNHCKMCDLFGIRCKGDRCVVCKQKMLPYE